MYFLLPSFVLDIRRIQIWLDITEAWRRDSVQTLLVKLFCFEGLKNTNNRFIYSGQIKYHHKELFSTIKFSKMTSQLPKYKNK